MSNLKRDIEGVLETVAEYGRLREVMDNDVAALDNRATSVDEATTQIINLVESVIPEEHTKDYKGYPDQYDIGYDACIRDIKSKLIDGSENND